MDTPDTEWLDSYRKKFRDAFKDGKSYEAGEIFIHSLLSSRDTYWKERVEETVAKLKRVSVLCRQCGTDNLEKATGLGKVAFELQCSECGNYQEANADVAQWNQALDTLLDNLK